MDYEVRTITEDEVPDWCGALNTGFHNPVGSVDVEVRRPWLILDRTWAGFDRGRVVSTLRSFPSRLTVPGGGELTVSAVSAVTTTATHRRRGLATRMVRADLAAAAARGDAASILIAAEWGIYGRYGYGAATEHQRFTVDTSLARLRQRPSGSVELVDRDTARAIAPEVYQRHRAAQPGEIDRSDWMWDIDYGLARIASRPEPKPMFHLIARDPTGVAIGVARYTVEPRWANRLAEGAVEVSLLHASEPAGSALLWSHLIGLDLVTSVRVGDRGPDEPLPWLLTNPRAAQPADRADFLWLRPLDMPALLSARTYPAPGRVVLDIVDADGLAGGRFAVESAAGAAVCAPTAEPADLTMDVAVFGSLYLGGYRLRTLATAGLIAVHHPGAVELADAMFRSPAAPWCSTWF